MRARTSLLKSRSRVTAASSSGRKRAPQRRPHGPKTVAAAREYSSLCLGTSPAGAGHRGSAQSRRHVEFAAAVDRRQCPFAAHEEGARRGPGCSPWVAASLSASLRQRLPSPARAPPRRAQLELADRGHSACRVKEFDGEPPFSLHCCYRFTYESSYQGPASQEDRSRS